MQALIALEFTLLAGLTALWIWRIWIKRGKSTPPGPKGWPIIGNLFDIPANYQWLTFAKWGEEYGPVTHVSAPGMNIIVLNTIDAALEFFERRSANYSDRLVTPMIRLGGLDRMFAAAPYGDPWKVRRKMFHQHFNSSVLSTYTPLQERVVGILTRNLLRDPGDFMHHIRLCAASLVLEIVYGHRVEGSGDKIVPIVEEGMEASAFLIRPNAHIVDLLTFLEYLPRGLPGTSFKSKAAECREKITALIYTPFNAAKERFEKDELTDCFIAQYLQQEDTFGLSREEYEVALAECAGATYGAASDTIVSALGFFVMLMVNYPEVQRRAQAEIDSVIGSSRLPSVDDREELPYVNALLKEVYRYMPVTPIGVPHKGLEEDVYQGYHIPAGALVIGNACSLLRDPESYANPHAFNPERFMGDKPERDPKFTAVFGFGRRVCPGRALADMSFFVIVASILAAFDIRSLKDEMGREIEVPIEQTDSVISAPVPFKCKISPRSEAARRLVEHS